MDEIEATALVVVKETGTVSVLAAATLSVVDCVCTELKDVRFRRAIDALAIGHHFAVHVQRTGAIDFTLSRE